MAIHIDKELPLFITERSFYDAYMLTCQTNPIPAFGYLSQLIVDFGLIFGMHNGLQLLCCPDVEWENVKRSYTGRLGYDHIKPLVMKEEVPQLFTIEEALEKVAEIKSATRPRVYVVTDNPQFSQNLSKKFQKHEKIKVINSIDASKIISELKNDKIIRTNQCEVATPK